MEERAIAHMDLDSFFVSVERLRDERLTGSKLAPLYLAMDKIRDRYGTNAIGKALNIDLNKRNPTLIQNNVS